MKQIISFDLATKETLIEAVKHLHEELDSMEIKVVELTKQRDDWHFLSTRYLTERDASRQLSDELLRKLQEVKL